MKVAGGTADGRMAQSSSQHMVRGVMNKRAADKMQKLYPQLTSSSVACSGPRTGSFLVSGSLGPDSRLAGVAAREIRMGHTPSYRKLPIKQWLHC
jgi:hypothetical protein